MSPRHKYNQYVSPYFNSKTYLEGNSHKKELEMQDRIEKFFLLPIGFVLSFFKSRRKNKKIGQLDITKSDVGA